MFCKKSSKELFSAFFLALYFFVVLFSQSFHNHSGFSFSADPVKKEYHSVASSDLSNCLSCHFLHTGNSLVPQDFEINFTSTQFYQQLLSEVQLPYHFAQTQVLFLRGPPNGLFNLSV